MRGAALKVEKKGGWALQDYSKSPIGRFRTFKCSLCISPPSGVPRASPSIAPYNCAPTGYYGPEWLNGDGFIGTGPWFQISRAT
jgi:hypothetical protein